MTYLRREVVVGGISDLALWENRVSLVFAKAIVPPHLSVYDASWRDVTPILLLVVQLPSSSAAVFISRPFVPFSVRI